jgi:protein involved in polysaccharide export with SLBB domain
MTVWVLRFASTLVLLGIATASSVAQTPPVTEARLDTRRAQATRRELEASLAQIDTILKSPGYSSRIRDSKRRESALIRDRLNEGDLQVGDQILLEVLNEKDFSGTFTIGAGRTLTLPGIPPIPLRGILRSEAEEYLAEQMSKYVRNPSVRVVTSIRLAVLGSVGKQGFYQVPADVLISDAIMVAGGPVGEANPNKSHVVRASSEILNQAEVSEAIVQGATLDQLNLRAGDQIFVDEGLRRASRMTTILGVLGLATSIAYLFTRLF